MATVKAQNTRFFQPTAIAGCQVWFDGADPLATGVPPANSATISTWSDKSGNGYNATPSSGRVAATFSSAFNCVYFQSSSVGYQTSYPANPINETMFIVANINSPANINNNTIIGGQLRARSFGFGYAGGAGGTGYSSYLNNADAWQNSGVTGPSAGVTALITGTVTTTTSVAVALNGSTFTTGSISAWSSGTTTYLGVDTTNSSYYFIGYVMEILFYNSVLNSTQQKQIEGYLAYKWGLQRSLPATHTFSRTPYFATSVYFPKAIPTIIGTNQKHPLTIAGISLWLDGLDITGTGSRYPTGTTVTTWADKSGNQRNATASSGGVNYTMTFGIYPGLVFTNSQYLLGSISITGNTLSIFSIFSQANQGTGGAGRIIALAATGQNDYNNSSYMGLLRQSGLSFGPYRNGTFTGNTLSGYDTPTIMEAWYDGTNQYSTINGGLTPLSNAISGNFAISAYAVANNTNLGDVPNGPLYGSIGEVIVYNISPTLLQRQLIEGYLAWKWGIQASLVTGHPYQTVPPSYPPFTIPVARSIVNSPLIPIIREGLIYHLDAGNINSYSGSGSTWTDLTGSGIAMTLYGSPTYSSANGGSILFVPASSQYGQTSASLASTPVWTIEFFTYYNGTNTATSPCLYTDVYPGSTSVIQTGLGSLGTFGSGCCPGATILQAGYYNGGWYVTPQQSPLVSGNWYHLVGTYDGTNIKLYINASLNKTTASATTAAGNTGGFRIMSRWDSADYWGGNVAVMRRYNRALSAAEISINYGAQKSRFGLV